jgi:hypothetical protein
MSRLSKAMEVFGLMQLFFVLAILLASQSVAMAEDDDALAPPKPCTDPACTCPAAGAKPCEASGCSACRCVSGVCQTA